jgi:outer membrane lipoprotein-sorting protein
MLGVLLGAFLAGTLVQAQTVPLPKPAPKSRPAAPSDANASTTATASTNQPTYAGTPPTAVSPPVMSKPQQPTQQQQQPTSLFPDPRRLLGLGNSSSVTFDANQRTLAAKMSSYLSSINTLSGNFVQVGSNGAKTTGDFIIQKPGKVRFQYDPPTPIDVIADGTTLAVRDRTLSTQDVIPLSQTPLRFLLSDRIDLLSDTNVVNIGADDVFASVTIEEKQVVGTSRLTLMFGAKDMQLKQWTVTDPQGYDTTVAVYNLNTAKKPGPDIFKIDFTQYNTGTPR